MTIPTPLPETSVTGISNGLSFFLQPSKQGVMDHKLSQMIKQQGGIVMSSPIFASHIIITSPGPLAQRGLSVPLEGVYNVNDTRGWHLVKHCGRVLDGDKVLKEGRKVVVRVEWVQWCILQGELASTSGYEVIGVLDRTTQVSPEPQITAPMDNRRPVPAPVSSVSRQPFGFAKYGTQNWERHALRIEGESIRTRHVDPSYLLRETRNLPGALRLGSRLHVGANDGAVFQSKPAFERSTMPSDSSTRFSPPSMRLKRIQFSTAVDKPYMVDTTQAETSGASRLTSLSLTARPSVKRTHGTQLPWGAAFGLPPMPRPRHRSSIFVGAFDRPLSFYVFPNGREHDDAYKMVVQMITVSQRRICKVELLGGTDGQDGGGELVRLHEATFLIVELNQHIPVSPFPASGWIHVDGENLDTAYKRGTAHLKIAKRETGCTSSRLVVRSHWINQCSLRGSMVDHRHFMLDLPSKFVENGEDENGIKRRREEEYEEDACRRKAQRSI